MMTVNPTAKNLPAAAPAMADWPSLLQAGSIVPLPSSAILKGKKSVSIEHQGVIYRLQVTKLGKLILTK